VWLQPAARLVHPLGSSQAPPDAILTCPGLSGRKAFFFEKKKQKTFVRCFKRRFPAIKRTLPVIGKSFLVLFFKKERFF
jgi:hypothetical protein